jgi:hypothetical protein
VPPSDLTLWPRSSASESGLRFDRLMHRTDVTTTANVALQLPVSWQPEAPPLHRALIGQTDGCYVREEPRSLFDGANLFDRLILRSDQSANRCDRGGVRHESLSLQEFTHV